MDPVTLTAIWKRRPADGAAVLLQVPGEPALTYAEADRASSQVANALVALGLRRGDRVALQVEKSPLALVVYLACIRSGAVLLAMNPAYTEPETDYLVADASPTIFVGEPSRTAWPKGPVVLTADRQGVGTLADAAAEQSDEFSDVDAQPDDLAAILYTSGTTGRPKGAMLSHRNLASNALILNQVWGFRPDDILLHALPIFHAHGLFVATNCVLASGASMTFLPRFSVDGVIEHLPQASVFMGVPTYYSRLVADPRLDPHVCRHGRLFVSGSAPLPVSVHADFRRRTGHDIVERYGMTETLMNTSNPFDGERRAGTVGLALPGTVVRIGAGMPAPATEGAAPVGAAPVGAAAEARGVGEIEVRGPNVFRGYWGRDDLAASAFTDDGFFRTGDLGTLDRDGYLTIVGRSTDLIISGGLNVYPKEVEDFLNGLEGIDESAVVGLADADFGEVVIAAVVLSPGQALDEAALRAVARQHLAAFKVPKRFTAVPALPRNAMGKVSKATIRSDLAATLGSGTSPTAHGGPMTAPGKSFFLTEEVHSYIVEHSSPLDDVLVALIEETAGLGPSAGMQIAAEQGSFITLLCQSLGVRHAVEVGTFTGYSALCIARGLVPGGRLLCCDVSEEWTSIARRYWERAGLADRIELRLAPAAETLRSLPATPDIDLAFIDADKPSYPTYYEELVTRLRPGGVILIDNVLQDGNVLHPAPDDVNATAMQSFNRLVAADERVDAVMLPIADGLTLVRKR